MNSNPEISIEPLNSVEEEITKSVRDRLTVRVVGSRPQLDIAVDVNQAIGALIDR